jgi:hydrogenase maturation protein HypF
LAAAKFHRTLADIICAVAAEQNIRNISLSGGVFQNKTLLAMVIKKLESKGLKVFTNTLVPTGDGGLALGQLYAKYRGFV